ERYQRNGGIDAQWAGDSLLHPQYRGAPKTRLAERKVQARGVARKQIFHYRIYGAHFCHDVGALT
ncbi:MAG TPA: hypothetical protein VJ742_11185, partial [Nitrososphaera sp.]|nr:hypothetical protein [Nitrososphaera sp.]